MITAGPKFGSYFTSFHSSWSEPLSYSYWMIGVFSSYGPFPATFIFCSQSESLLRQPQSSPCSLRQINSASPILLLAMVMVPPCEEPARSARERNCRAGRSNREKSGSQRTRRWRKRDSNYWSRLVAKILQRAAEIDREFALKIVRCTVAKQVMAAVGLVASGTPAEAAFAWSRLQAGLASLS